MLTVDHNISPSTIHGLGVFSNEKILTGQLVWTFSPVVDREVPIEQLLTMPDHVLRMFARHAWYVEERSTFVIGTDGDYFMNHSDEPNLTDDGEYMYAARDIEVGEELTCDYSAVTVVEFDPNKGRAHAKDIREFYTTIIQQNAPRRTSKEIGMLAAVSCSAGPRMQSRA
jgi:uncharacterized protein